MGQKLTLIVTCTDRKSVSPSPDLMLRNLASGTLHQRVGLWKERLSRAAHQRALRQLYQGETWTQVGQLERAAEKAGFEPRLMVASAGLGLRCADSLAPAYSATFSSGHADSIAGTVVERREWWTGLNDDDPRRPWSTSRASTLLVLSESYAKVVAPELQELSSRSDVLVVGGSNDIPTDIRLPADRGLRHELGGTASSLNVRTAIAWLSRLTSPVLVCRESRRSWERWAGDMRRPDSYDRRPLSDVAVLQFIGRLRLRDPSVSKSRALRLLRDKGFACEQQRFGKLFQRAGSAQ